MIKEKINKAFDWYSSLESMKKLVVTIVIVIILFFLVKIISSIDLSKKIIDYSWSSGEELISSLEKSNDREIYLKTREVVSRLFNTMNDEYSIKDNKVSLNDWYKYALFDEYKISKGNFKSLLRKINEDYNGKMNIYGSSKIVLDSIIENVYVYSSSYGLYVCEMNINDSKYYIGLKFESDNSYSIFYIG